MEPAEQAAELRRIAGIVRGRRTDQAALAGLSDTLIEVAGTLERLTPSAAEQAWANETDRDVIYNSMGKHPYMVGFDRGFAAGMAADRSEQIQVVITSGSNQSVGVKPRFWHDFNNPGCRFVADMPLPAGTRVTLYDSEIEQDAVVSAYGYVFEKRRYVMLGDWIGTPQRTAVGDAAPPRSRDGADAS